MYAQRSHDDGSFLQNLPLIIENMFLKVVPCKDIKIVGPKGRVKGLRANNTQGQMLCLYNNNDNSKYVPTPNAESDTLPYATICGGDSGGPLVVCDGDRIVLIGVANGILDREKPLSKEEPICKKNGTISTYVDIQHYLPWIRGIIGRGKNQLL